jgi:hypothetical protein
MTCMNITVTIKELYLILFIYFTDIKIDAKILSYAVIKMKGNRPEDFMKINQMVVYFLGSKLIVRICQASFNLLLFNNNRVYCR